MYEVNSQGGWIVPDRSAIADGCTIPDHSVVGNGCKIGRHCTIGMFCKICDNCTIGDYVVIDADCEIGECCKIGDGCVIGDGYKIVSDSPGSVRDEVQLQGILDVARANGSVINGLPLTAINVALKTMWL